MTRSTCETATQEHARLKAAASDALFYLWNIRALADLMDRVDEIHSDAFTDEIAGGVRMTREMADRGAKLLEALL